MLNLHWDKSSEHPANIWGEIFHLSLETVVLDLFFLPVRSLKTSNNIHSNVSWGPTWHKVRWQLQRNHNVDRQDSSIEWYNRSEMLLQEMQCHKILALVDFFRTSSSHCLNNRYQFPHGFLRVMDEFRSGLCVDCSWIWNRWSISNIYVSYSKSKDRITYSYDWFFCRFYRHETCIDWNFNSWTLSTYLMDKDPRVFQATRFMNAPFKLI
jgi:hypothetical protein